MDDQKMQLNIGKLKRKDLDILYCCWKKEKHVGGSFRLVKDGKYYGIQYYPNLFGKILTIILFPIYVIRDGWGEAVDTVDCVINERCSYTHWIMDKNKQKYCNKLVKERFNRQ